MSRCGRVLGVQCDIKERMGDKGKKVASFKKTLPEYQADTDALAAKISSWCQQFPTIGFEAADMKYKD